MSAPPYVTNIVKSWYTGTYSNYGFVLKDATESGTSQWTTFYSSDAASPNKPELVINYNWPDHAYAGFNRGGSNKGVSATITLPSKLPNVSDSGESVWVSTSKDSNGEWVQTGARYYSTFTNFKTYTEHYQSGVYKLTTVGVHALGASISYKVEYNSTDGKWHAYIAGVDKVSSALATINNGVQGNAETHKRNIEMGPFTFSNVKTKSKSPGHTAVCIQLPNESDGKTMWPKDVKQKGGKYCFLRLTKNGAQNDRTGMVINRYLKSRTGTIKLEAGQTIYFHFDESERTTAKLVIK